jgi:signal transduction histidine kinase
VALRQLFANLLSNAVKYAGDRSRPLVEIGYAERAHEHEFFVQDNGVGIAPEYHEQIFQLFRRGPETKAKGFGIGLTTAKAVVLRHGGRIWVESQEDQGATFRFVLPRRGGTG